MVFKNLVRTIQTERYSQYKDQSFSAIWETLAMQAVSSLCWLTGKCRVSEMLNHVVLVRSSNHCALNDLRCPNALPFPFSYILIDYLSMQLETFMCRGRA